MKMSDISPEELNVRPHVSLLHVSLMLIILVLINRTDLFDNWNTNLTTFKLIGLQIN